MNCSNCGNPLTNEDKFCKKCGAVVQPVGEPVLNQTPAMDNSALTGAPIPSQPMNLEAAAPITGNQGSGMNTQPVTPPNNQGGKNNNMILGILIVVIVALAGYLIYTNFIAEDKASNNNNDEVKDTDNDNDNDNDTDQDDSNDDKNNNETAYTTKVNIGNYEMVLPNGYAYQMNADESVNLMYQDEKNFVILGYTDNSYTNVKLAFGNMISEMENEFDYEFSEQMTKKINDKEFTFSEIVAGELNMTIAITKIGTATLTLITTHAGEHNTDDLERLASSIDSAKIKSDTSNSLLPSINMEDVLSGLE